MGVIVHGGTMPGGVTPACNECGVALCWDISAEDYEDAKAFWDAWVCQDCNGGEPLSLKAWQARHRPATALRLPRKVLAGYPKHTACIRYRDTQGETRDWFVGANPAVDNEDTLREHLGRHIQGAEFLGWAVK